MSAPTVYMLDTNTVSYLIKGVSIAARHRSRVEQDRGALVISVITEAELLAGLAKKLPSTQLKRSIDDFLAVVPRLPWDSTAAASFVQLGVWMRSAGLSLSPLDYLIAAHAHAQQTTLVTHDRAFHRLGNFLSVEDWATDL